MEFRFLFLFPILLLTWINGFSQAPFSKGVNLTGWFQAPAARQIQFYRFTKKDFQNIKSLGSDVIRLPINLHAMTSGEPEYIPDPLFLEFLDQAVDWAEELQIHLILDNHTFDVSSNTDPSIGPVLVKVWTHMARHFKNRSALLYYEVLNEPHGIDDAVWGNIQQSVIDAIRTEDTEHFIIVGPANWNNYQNLTSLPVYSDAKLLYTFHFYDPFIFTHQGASWVDPSMVPLSGVPFPYKADEMPATPASLKGTWIESGISNYRTEGTVARVKQLIDIAVAFKNERGVALFCGEFGVYNRNSPGPDRVAWYNVVQSYLEEKNIPWTIWDYTGGFGLFEKDSPELFEYDLNVSLLEALEFSIPPQDTYFQKPLLEGFTIYQDYVGEGITQTSGSGAGIVDFYSADRPLAGPRCIYWSGAGQYDAMAFNFTRDLDLSLLMENNHALKFSVRGNNALAKFDVRFIDSKKNETDLPWRMGKTIQGIPADNEWHTIVLPLRDLEEKGAWENVYYPPDGKKFDWNSVDRFEIIPEHQPLNGIEFSFDEIYVAGEPVLVTGIGEEGAGHPDFSINPNPVSRIEGARIEFTTAMEGPVDAEVYDVHGRTIKRFRLQRVPPGNHSMYWDTTNTHSQRVGTGLYFVRIKTAGWQRVGRVVVIGE